MRRAAGKITPGPPYWPVAGTMETAGSWEWKALADDMTRLTGIVLLLLVVLARPRAAERPAGPAVVIGQSVRLRTGPAANRPILTTLTRGQTVQVTGRAAGWYRIETALKGGWVAEDYLRLSLDGRVSPDSRLGLLLARAQSLLGHPYVYAHAGPDRFDCSGLTCYLFHSVGLSLPREAGGQMAAGIGVTREELRPGDLVFFATNGRGSVSHVGVYLFGGDFIHASSGRGRVTTSTLDQGYYNSRFVGAARVIDE